MGLSGLILFHVVVLYTSVKLKLCSRMVALMWVLCQSLPM